MICIGNIVSLFQILTLMLNYTYQFVTHVLKGAVLETGVHFHVDNIRVYEGSLDLWPIISIPFQRENHVLWVMDYWCIANSAAFHFTTGTGIIIHIINIFSAKVVVQTNMKVFSTRKSNVEALLYFCVLVFTSAASTFNTRLHQSQEKLVNNRCMDLLELSFVLPDIGVCYFWACFSVVFIIQFIEEVHKEFLGIMVFSFFEILKNIVSQNHGIIDLEVIGLRFLWFSEELFHLHWIYLRQP